ncbi:hypothetical protein FF021_07010 [Leptospira noguchii]|nr:hypothetical protein FF021_07010 [Leptospira noguchii]
MNSLSISVSWKRSIEVVLLVVAMEFCNNSNVESCILLRTFQRVWFFWEFLNNSCKDKRK